MMSTSGLALLAGTAHPELAGAISRMLETPLTDAQVRRFPDGEVDVKVLDDIRSRDVFVIQPTCPPVNENLVELLTLIDCCVRASVGRVTAVIPYFGYARKDRKDEGRVPITAKLVANLLTKAGADRVLTVDLHAAQIQGFFDVPVDHLYAAPVLVRHFREQRIENLTVVAPDVGSSKIKTWGLGSSATARPARWRRPRESAPTGVRRRSVSSTRSSTSALRRLMSPRDMPCSRPWKRSISSTRSSRYSGTFSGR